MKNQQIIISSLIISLCLISNVVSNNDPNLEWTDPVSGTYYNIASLKKDPK
jgi:hypothetical protein